MQYTNQELVENFIGSALTEKQSNLLSTLVYAVENRIDKELATTFKNDSALYGATRYFSGGNRHVDIDPCQNITAVALVDPELTVTSDLTSTLYVKRPLNAAVTKLITLRYGHLPRGFSNLKVTADFTEYGSEEVGVPSDIKTIATRVVGAMLIQPEAALGIQQEQVEGHSVTYQRNISGTMLEDIFSKDVVVKSLMDARHSPFIDDSPVIGDYGELGEDYLDV